MAATRKKSVSRSAKGKKSPFKKLLNALNPATPKGRFLLFVVLFALIGGGYMAYRSFAATISTPVYYLNNGNDGSPPEAVFAFGNPGDKPVACDWDGNRSDGIGVWQDPSVTFHLSDTLAPTNVNRVLSFGNHGDMPVCGDWNGDGRAGVGVFRPSNFTWYLSDEVAPNKVSKTVAFGQAGDIPLVCDWDGNGRDDIGVYRPSNSTFYLSFSTLGFTDLTIPFGNPGDMPVCGNWDGVGGDGLGVYRPSNSTFYLSDSVKPTNVNHQFIYGNPGDKPVVGDWDGNGITSVGIYRNTSLPSPAKTTYTCTGDTTIEVKDKATCDAILTYARIGREQAAAQPTAPQAVTNVGTPTLSLGANGAAVSSLQQRLANRGFWIAVSGDFNQATDVTVKSFQKVRDITADGVVGPQTYGQLDAAEAEGWVFNPNDPRLGGPSAPTAVAVIVDRTTNQQPSTLPTADAINTFFALLRAAEIAAQAQAAQDAANAAAQAAAQQSAAQRIAAQVAAQRAADELARRVRAAQIAQNLRNRLSPCPPIEPGDLITCINW
ncbi:MAG: peptidoglycan-binding protein [Candidatus Saccharimonadales bacterium]